MLDDLDIHCYLYIQVYNEVEYRKILVSKSKKEILQLLCIDYKARKVMAGKDLVVSLIVLLLKCL